MKKNRENACCRVLISSAVSTDEHAQQATLFCNKMFIRASCIGERKAYLQLSVRSSDHHKTVALKRSSDEDFPPWRSAGLPLLTGK
jgi:hypothetical protein